MGRKKAADRWRRVLDEHAVSGVSVSEFCRRGELNPSSFYRWRKKLGKAEPFVPVSVVEDVSRPFRERFSCQPICYRPTHSRPARRLRSAS